MNIIIIGGGKIGYYLAKTLAQNKHDITIIEKKKETCQIIANDLSDFNVRVFNGDGTNVESLYEANIEKSDVFIAVTGKDEENLAACLFAKQHFGVGRTIARVNNPKNMSVFEKLGVDSVVSGTQYLADVIEFEIEPSITNKISILRSSEFCIKDFAISEKSGIYKQKIMDLSLPQDCLIVAIIRNKNIVVPSGTAMFEKDDVVIVLVKQQHVKQLYSYFTGRGVAV